MESGYKIMSFEEFSSSITITYYIYSILGKVATNIIAAMSGSMPPYIAALRPVDQQSFDSRPKLGNKPEYEDIRAINSNHYGMLSRRPEAALTTQNY